MDTTSTFFSVNFSEIDWFHDFMSYLLSRLSEVEKNKFQIHQNNLLKKKTKLRGLSPQAN
jgi:hypothetical protein